MDKNGDGDISMEEFRDALAKLNLFYSTGQFRTLMSIVNPRGRGYTLTYNDFVELIFPSRSHWSVDISIQQSVQVCLCVSAMHELASCIHLRH